MCEYCEKDKVIMKQTVMSDNMVGGMFKNATAEEIWECSNFEIGVLFDDRGYIRLVDLDDYNCLDHGEKIKINYCPMCGRNLNE